MTSQPSDSVAGEEPASAKTADGGPASVDDEEGGDAAFLRQLLGRELAVPVRSSTGRRLEATDLPLSAMRHGGDERGSFLAAYSDPQRMARYGPPGSDWVLLSGRDFLEQARRAGERVVLDPGAPAQREVPLAIVASLTGSAAEAARQGAQPPPAVLTDPGEVPDSLATALRATLEELPHVHRAWLLRRGEGWTIGVQPAPTSPLSDFDEVRNRLHAVATEQLGTRRLLAVTDLRAPSLRDQYHAVAPAFYERVKRSGLLDRLFGRRR